MIESNEDLVSHLRDDREVYARALKRYETGEMRFVANNVDISTYQVMDLQAIVNNIDQLLDRMAESPLVGEAQS